MRLSKSSQSSHNEWARKSIPIIGLHALSSINRASVAHGKRERMRSLDWAQTLAVNGEYYEGYVENLPGVLYTTYGVRRSHCSSQPPDNSAGEASLFFNFMKIYIRG